ncbi:hypothetical protein M427DRAFT_144615 [Gonapodya prolifera JEL478]|uniref:Uncharacterized protein n=1 Tax=Gonapodya prolifera (strain JEL478) TaxID=1344416 RepID=A0A139AJD2_GONPJ|nr:hypothetical protein M427DRAFT_144615 [Gonapodya prolifera JEL478]|eukprot:KXS16808.1 hypothetical protein M427DRAFT_144615 [Gonapodya prolifera JEL478]
MEGFSPNQKPRRNALGYFLAPEIVDKIITIHPSPKFQHSAWYCLAGRRVHPEVKLLFATSLESRVPSRVVLGRANSLRVKFILENGPNASYIPKIAEFAMADRVNENRCIRCNQHLPNYYLKRMTSETSLPYLCSSQGSGRIGLGCTELLTMDEGIAEVHYGLSVEDSSGVAEIHHLRHPQPDVVYISEARSAGRRAHGSLSRALDFGVMNLLRKVAEGHDVEHYVKVANLSDSLAETKRMMRQATAYDNIKLAVSSFVIDAIREADATIVRVFGARHRFQGLRRQMSAPRQVKSDMVDSRRSIPPSWPPLLQGYVRHVEVLRSHPGEPATPVKTRTPVSATPATAVASAKKSQRQPPRKLAPAHATTPKSKWTKRTPAPPSSEVHPPPSKKQKGANGGRAVQRKSRGDVDREASPLRDPEQQSQ